MKRVVLMLATGLACMACNKLSVCEDDKLSVAKTAYSGQALKINGFYYGEPRPDWQGVVSHDLIILSGNGTFLLAGGAEPGKMDEEIRRLTPMPDIVRQTKYAWGRFVLEGRTLTIEHWNPASCGHGVTRLSGTVLNDTTFVLTAAQVRKNGRTQQEDAQYRTYRFRAFSPKPDSVVSFTE